MCVFRALVLNLESNVLLVSDLKAQVNADAQVALETLVLRGFASNPRRIR